MTVAVHQAQCSPFHHLAGVTGADDAGRTHLEQCREAFDERPVGHAVDQAVYGGHAELVVDQFADIGERELRRKVVCTVGRTSLIAVGAADGITMMSVGDDDGVRADRCRDRCDAFGVGDAFDDVSDTGLVDTLPDRLPGFAQQLGQPAAQRQSPDWGQVGLGGTGEIEAVGLGLRRGLFVWEHATSAFIDDFEGAEYPDRFAGGTRLVDEVHSVEREGGAVIADQHAVVQPVGKALASSHVAVVAVGFAGDVDGDDVVPIECEEVSHVSLGNHVIRRRCDEIERLIGAEAHCGKGFEPRHTYRLPLLLRDFLAMTDDHSAVLCDLDGVVWLAHEPIAGSVDAIARLRARGHRVLFVTNNSASELATQVAALERIGIPARGDVLTSAMAGALLVLPGERVMVCGGPGIYEALDRRGAVVDNDGKVDAVVVGFHRQFDYDTMRRAADAVRAGARLIGTNDDATYPTPDGPIPGGGAIIAGIEVAAGVAAEIAGKPYGAMVALVRAELGSDLMERVVMVGDRPSTDGLFAQALGCRYAQVWSGVTNVGETVVPVPEMCGANLASIVDQLLA